MLKKSICLAVLFVCLFTVSAFAQKAAPKQPAKPAAKPAPLNDSDFQVGPAKIGEKMNVKILEKAFGMYRGYAPQDKEERVCILEFNNGSIFFITCDDIIVGIDIRDRDIKTARGLTLHSEFKRAISLYGQPNLKKYVDTGYKIGNYTTSIYGTAKKGIKINYGADNPKFNSIEKIGYIYIYI